MGVDIGGRSNITVSKPFLDVLQRNAVCIKQAGAAVTKIVKTNLFQSLLFEKQVKMLCDKIGFDKSAHRIYIDVVQIIRAVAITTDLLIECLFCFEITGSLSVAENLFNEGVIKESLNKIAAFLSVRMGLKECGNFYSVVFSLFTGAKQFILLQVLVEVFNFPVEVTITAT